MVRIAFFFNDVLYFPKSKSKKMRNVNDRIDYKTKREFLFISALRSNIFAQNSKNKIYLDNPYFPIIIHKGRTYAC